MIGSESRYLCVFMFVLSPLFDQIVPFFGVYLVYLVQWKLWILEDGLENQNYPTNEDDHKNDDGHDNEDSLVVVLSVKINFQPYVRGKLASPLTPLQKWSSASFVCQG